MVQDEQLMAKKPFPVAGVIHHYLEKWTREQWAPHRHFQANTTEPLAARHARINLLYRASKASDPDYLSRLFKNLVDGSDAPAALRKAFLVTIIHLAIDNDIIIDMPDAAAPLQFSEQRALTTTLLDIEHRLIHENTILPHFSYGASLIVQGMVQEHLPPILDGPSPALVPLLSLIKDSIQCIERILITFVDDLNGEPPKQLAFEATRKQLIKNLLAVSRLTEEQAHIAPHRIVLPEAAGLDASECARQYLAQTPFLPFFLTQVPFVIPRDTYKEHCAIFAPTGHGKTQTLQHLILSFLKEEDPPPMFIIDSMGAMLKQIERLDIFATRLKDRLVIIDPTDEKPPALNLFKLHGSPSLYFYLFKAIDQSLTQRQATMISYLIRLMQRIDGATLDTLREVCESKAPLHENEIAQLEPIERDFFKQFYATKGADPLIGQTKQQIAQRLYTIGRMGTFNHMFSARENSFDAYDCIQKKKIVLINTDASPEGLDEASPVMGRFIIAQCLAAARSRAKLPLHERHLALLIVDEAKAYLDDQAERILSDARQFGLGLILATQAPHQLPEGVQREIATNTTIKMIGPVDYSVASRLARDMHSTPEAIMGTQVNVSRKYTEFITHVRNLTPQAIKLTIPLFTLENEPKMDETTWRAMRKRNRERYGSNTHPSAPSRSTISHRTNVSFPDFDVTLPALLDSGASMTVLPTEYSIQKDMVRFTLGTLTIERAILRMITLTSFTDAETRHPIIALTMKVGDHTALEEIALTDQGSQMLVGRSFMAGRIVVDSSKPFKW